MPSATRTGRRETARGLAWLAERADGLRDQDLVLIRNSDGKLDLVPADSTTADAILEVRTPSRKKQKPRTARTLKIEKEWDAVFLSESAVGKFLIPYYVSQRLLTKAELEGLRIAYQQNERVIGIIHIPPSRPMLLFDDGHAEEYPVGLNSGVDMKLQDEGIGESW